MQDFFIKIKILQLSHNYSTHSKRSIINVKQQMITANHHILLGSMNKQNSTKQLNTLQSRSDMKDDFLLFWYAA